MCRMHIHGLPARQVQSGVSPISVGDSNPYLGDGSFKISTYGKNNIVHFSDGMCLKLVIILSGKVAIGCIDASGNLMTIAGFYRNEIWAVFVFAKKSALSCDDHRKRTHRNFRNQ